MDLARVSQLVRSLEGAPSGALGAAFCVRTAELVGVADATYALIGPGGRRETLGASSEAAGDLDRWQFTFEEGPCLDAASSASVTIANAAEAATRWPRLAAKASELGYGALAGIPLSVGGVVFGALDLQSTDHSFRPGCVDAGTVVAGEVGPLIVDRLAGRRPDERGPLARDLIHQATGRVSVQLGGSVDDALAALRAHAWSHDRVLEDVAEEVIGGRLRFGPD